MPTSRRGTRRIALIDALRAFALFGILQVNILSYLWGTGGLTVFTETPSLSDHVVYLLVATFVSTKFLSLFAFLFGHGFAVQMRSLRRAAQHTPKPEANARLGYRRRLWFLLALGVLHGTFVYFGDILTAYAVCAFVLLLYAQARPATLAAHTRNWFIGYVLLSLALLLLAAAAGSVPPAQAAAIPPEVLARFDAAARGSYLDFLQVNAFDYVELTFLSLTLALPYIVGLFLLGALAGRLGWLTQPQRHPQVWRRARQIGWAALPVAAAGAWLTLQGQINVPGNPSVLGFTLTSLSFPLAALYLAWIVRAHTRGALDGVVAWIAPAGRMPLTNYLLQSVAMGVLLSGWGLGWGERLGVAQLSALALLIVIAQIAASRIWMRHVGQGPVEALWRRATYRAGGGRV
jgi:uncharacterized protein